MESVIKDYVIDQKIFSNNDFTIKALTNGMSNSVFCCEGLDKSGTIKRIIAKNINDNYQHILPFLLTLNSKYIPKIITHDMNSNIVLEEFVDGTGFNLETLTDDDIKLIINGIYQLHKDLNSNKSNTSNLLKSNSVKLNEYYKRVHSFLNLSRFDIDESLLLKYIESFDEYTNNMSDDFIVSHNDMHAYNIIRGVNQLYFIDLEFIGLNHYLYDYVNFNEELKVYIEPNRCKEINDIIITQICELYDEPLEGIKPTINLLAIYNNLFWFIWSLDRFLETKNPSLLDYADKRYRRFTELLGITQVKSIIRK